MGMLRLTRGVGLVGDILLDGAKIDKCVKIRIGTGGTAVGTSQTMTSFILPSQAIVYDAFLNVLTATTAAAQTILVGTSGTQAGFINASVVTSTGLVHPLQTSATSGTAGNFWLTSTLGSLLSDFTAGSTVAGFSGFFNTKTYQSDSNASRTVGFTPSSSAWVAFSADLYLCFVDFTK